MPPRLHEVAQDGVLSQLPAGFQAVQPFHQDETVSIASHQNGHLQSDLQNALGDVLRLFGVKGRLALARHIDVCDCKFLLLHHGRCDACSKPDKLQRAVQTRSRAAAGTHRPRVLLAHRNWSLILSNPAITQGSSTPGEPERPTPPITSFPTLIGTPPAMAITLGSVVCARRAGFVSKALMNSSVVIRKVRAV